MSLELVPYKAEHAIEIIRQQAKQPGGLEAMELVQQWAKAKESKGPALSGFVEGSLVGCGGLEICWPGVAEGWCLFAKDINKYDFTTRLGFARTIKLKLNEWVVVNKLVRVQAPMRVDFLEGIRMVEWLGFECEGRLRKFHPDRCDAFMFGRITEDQED